MASLAKEISVDLWPYLRLFTDGTVERIASLPETPASDDPSAAVRTKDVVIDPGTGLSVRIFAPRRRQQPRKLPLVVYIHGGAFCLGSAADPALHGFVATLVERGDVVAVSVDYRLAPENPMPIPFDDCWAAFRWACGGGGGDPWLSELADFRRVFVGGESAGATIANDMAVRVGDGGGCGGAEVAGLFLVHPYFGGKKLSELYRALFPGSSGGGDDDPRLNPAVDPRIGRMAGRRAVFMVAEKDFVTEKAKAYYEGLKKSEWSGEVEIMESEGEDHCFHLTNPTCDKAVALMDRLINFIHFE